MRVGVMEAAQRALIRRHERLTNWHKHFLLAPLWVAEGDCRWLEWVERKGDCFESYEGDIWRWSFRLPQASAS